MTVRGAELGGTDPAQPLAATVPWAHTRGDVASCPPRTSAGDPSLGPGLRLPAEPLSERGAAGGCSEAESGGRRRGHARYLTVRCRTLEEPWVGDEEVLLFRSSSDGPLPLSEPGLPFSALSLSYLVARGDTASGEMWHPLAGTGSPLRSPGLRVLGMFCSTPAAEQPQLHRCHGEGGRPRGPPAPRGPGGAHRGPGEGQPTGTYATEHWAKARYSSSTSSPLFSSLRNSWTQLGGAGG